MAKVKMEYSIYHYCLNENLPKEHPDFCFNCWVDEAPNSSTLSQQNWKYCKSCEDKGNVSVSTKDYKTGIETSKNMIDTLDKYKKETKEVLSRVSCKFINGGSESDLETIFNKYYPNVKMIKGLYK